MESRMDKIGRVSAMNTERVQENAARRLNLKRIATKSRKRNWKVGR